MGKPVKSAKGVSVDFDTLKIKEQLAAAPTPMEVKNRQNFIENRLKRRLKKKLPVVEKAAVEVEPNLPEPETTNLGEEILPKEKKPVAKTKQKARRKTVAKKEE